MQHWTSISTRFHIHIYKLINKEREILKYIILNLEGNQNLDK